MKPQNDKIEGKNGKQVQHVPSCDLKVSFIGEHVSMSVDDWMAYSEYCREIGYKSATP